MSDEEHPEARPTATHRVEATPVRVFARKFDGSLHRSWLTRLVRRSGALIVLEGVFETEVRHDLLGTIQAGTLSTEFYWTDRWYSVFRFHQPAGALRNFYCNVNSPAEFAGDTLTYVDLDIDVLVAPDFSYRVLDEDEFEAHAALFGYTEDMRLRVRESLSELLRLIEARDFPFDRAD